MTLLPGLDHLVVMAANLDEGVAWCEATLGVTPGPGGEHAFMGTHNRLLPISSPAFPQAYLEIIAINPVAAYAQPAGIKRWFDMEDEALAERIRQHGPALVHWVARVPDVAHTVADWAALGLDRGPVVQARRALPDGSALQWQITVRLDGQRLMDGCLPTLIQWGERHPAAGMTDCGVQLQGLFLQHPDARQLVAAVAGLQGDAVTVTTGPARLRAQLLTPLGRVTLDSP